MFIKRKHTNSQRKSGRSRKSGRRHCWSKWFLEI